MTTARAALFHSAKEPFELREVPIPALGPGEILVRVRLCSLCGSDLHSYSGKRSVATPTILGHEIIGDVAAIEGSSKCDLRGRPIAVGDRITWSIVAHCGHCFACLHDMPQKCERSFKYGHERWTDARPLSGGLADYCVLSAETSVLKLPPSLPDQTACFANCAAATVAGAFRIAGECRGQSVLIFGAGMLGLNACAMASHRGASDVIVTDVSADRLALAQRFGATAGVPFRERGEELLAEVRQRTEGRGVDLAIELSGSPEAMEASLSAVRTGGRVIFVGAVAPTRPIQVDAEQIVRRLLAIHGLHNYTPPDLIAAVDFHAAIAARFPFHELIVATFPLSQIDAAFQSALTGQSLRIAVRP